MNYSIKIEGLEELVRDFNKAPKVIADSIYKASYKSAELVRKRMSAEAPYRSGALSATIMATVSPLRTSIYPTQHYAKWVEQGRRKVTPVRSRVLRFAVGGHYIFRPRAKATKPNPFVRRTYVGTKSQVQNIFQDVVDKLMVTLRGSG